MTERQHNSQPRRPARLGVAGVGQGAEHARTQGRETPTARRTTSALISSYIPRSGPKRAPLARRHLSARTPRLLTVDASIIHPWMHELSIHGSACDLTRNVTLSICSCFLPYVVPCIYFVAYTCPVYTRYQVWYIATFHCIFAKAALISIIHHTSSSNRVT